MRLALLMALRYILGRLTKCWRTDNNPVVLPFNHPHLMNAIVTGASRGIGKAVAMALAARGYNLVLCARKMSGLETVASAIAEKHPDVQQFLVEADCSKAEDCQQLAKRALTECRTIDVLVNNVGMYSVGSFTEEPEGMLSDVLNANLFSAYHLSRALVPAMRTANSGHIFNICSVLSREIREEAAAYTVSKQALYALSKVMSAELRPDHIKVTAILPGSVNTSSWEGMDAPVQDFVQPEDIAAAIEMVLDSSAGALFDEIVVRPVRKDF